ncbi:MAG: YigZ family protein [Lachnospiraceae bacterium]|nr:YigZ family protein [Lachnospiraceae bacterium]
MDDHYVLISPGEGEITEKKSRFIGHAMPISGEAEATLLIDQIRRKYWDARHNCYAYVTGENGEISRCSDDGEPSGTAGRPILECINGAGLKGVLVVVTRYFGGTLLGTGGLVRAYTQATQAALNNAEIRHMRRGCRLSVKSDYNGAEKIRRSLEALSWPDTATDAKDASPDDRNVRIEDTQYTDTVTMTVIVSSEALEQTLDTITQVSLGRAEVQITDNGYFAL